MMIRIAPKPAPPVTPITSGEASGLPSAPCRIAPAIPSAAPTISASTVRGSRSVSTICCVGPAAALAEEDVDHLGERHLDRAERQRGDGRDGERGEQRREDEGAARQRAQFSR